MIYLIYGNQTPTIKSQIKKIAKSFLGDEGFDEFNFIKLDGNNTLVQDAIDECRYVSLGYDKKVVSLENCYFLLKPKPKNKIDSDQDYDLLKKYIEEDKDNEESLFILSSPSLTLDEKNQIVSLLKTNAKIVEIADPDEKSFLEYVRSYCLKYQINIDKDALSELASRTDGDVALFKNSIEKLTLYTDHIRYKDVALLVTRKPDDNAFLLSNYLIEGKNIEAIALFRDLRIYNVEPVTLISQLANQFRLLNEVRYLLKDKKMSQDEVAKELKIKPGRVYVLSKSFSRISSKAILRALDDLYKLDLAIKSGEVDRFYAFEMFILNFKSI